MSSMRAKVVPALFVAGLVVGAAGVSVAQTTSTTSPSRTTTTTVRKSTTTTVASAQPATAGTGAARTTG